MSTTAMPSSGSARVLTPAPSPTTRAQPLVALFEPVAAPERLAVDEEERRAEHAARQRGRDRVAQVGARLIAFDAIEHRGRLGANRGRQRGHLRRRAEIVPFAPVT